ncbi:MAG TPA: hypothetical protein VJ831_04600 [Jatrophihabitantaceae bacterium]|nr:hypothetical protein [Jatrophihabitantaceae bacterium]
MNSSTFPITGAINLVGRVGHGSFRVEARDGIDEATVTVEPRGDAAMAERATVELRGSTLLVSLPRQGGVFDLPIFGNRARDAVDIVAVVPTGTPVKISTFTAEITTTGRLGAADLASGVATIDVEAIDGDLRLRFGSGKADVGFVRGAVQSRAGSGTVHFGEVGGALVSVCGSGDITVDTARGPVRTRAGSGDAALGSVFDDVNFVSGSGSVTIGLPAGRSAQLDVTTGSGRVESDLPVEAKSTSTQRPLRLRIRTGSGDIKLVRAAA